VDVHLVLKAGVIAEGVYEPRRRLKSPADEASTALVGGLFEVSMNLGPEGAIALPATTGSAFLKTRALISVCAVKASRSRSTADTTMGTAAWPGIRRRAGGSLEYPRPHRSTREGARAVGLAF
jgi:hypothetical protein